MHQIIRTCKRKKKGICMTRFGQLALGIALSAFSVGAVAGVTSISDRFVFNAQGAIAYNSNFVDFGAGYGFPANPFTRGDVTYSSSTNMTVGSGTPYSIGNFQTVMANNNWSPIMGTIATAPAYTLFGFDAAVTSGPVRIIITTNNNSYSFSGLILPNGSPNFAFEGFEATGTGEYFTAFGIYSSASGNMPGITNVAVGSVNAVPEPETYAMLLTGLGLLGFMARRRKQKAA
jgi:hypothetical protein